MPTVLMCDAEWAVSAMDGTVSCSGAGTAVDASNMALLIAGGFDADAATVGFAGVITLFAVGLGVGLIVQVIRKLRA